MENNLCERNEKDHQAFAFAVIIYFLMMKKNKATAAGKVRKARQQSASCWLLHRLFLKVARSLTFGTNWTRTIKRCAAVNSEQTAVSCCDRKNIVLFKKNFFRKQSKKKHSPARQTCIVTKPRPTDACIIYIICASQYICNYG